MQLKKYLQQFSSETKKMFQEFFNKKTNKKQRANMWTFQRLIIPLVTLITSITGLITGISNFLIISSLFVGYGGLTDFFDGRSARKYNSASEYGKLLDQISDKFFAGVIGINMAIINPIFIPVIILEGAIGSVNIYYKKHYPEISDKSKMIGRIKQWPLFATLFLGFLTPINNIFNITTNLLIVITSILQSLTLIDYSVTKYKEAKQIDKKKEIQEKIRDCNMQEEQYLKKEKQLKMHFYKKHCNTKKKVKVKRKDR